MAYPNALVMSYLKSTGSVGSKMEKYQKLLSLGYQKILSFQRPAGGFDWWGRGRPLVWLSAYGLMQLTDMSRVYPVDPQVMDRVANFLLNKQKKDGSWDSFGQTHGVLVTRLPQPALTLTAYTAFALASSGVQKPGLERAIEYIKKNWSKGKDNAYLLALMANGLVAYQDKSGLVEKIFQRLIEQKQQDSQGVFWKSGGSVSHSRGVSAQVETTALVTHAFLQAGTHLALVQKSLAYLFSKRYPQGGWGSTQATILTLKTLVLASKKQSVQKSNITLFINGQKVKTLHLTEKNSDILHQVDLSDFAQAGKNTIRLESSEKVNLPYQIVSSYYLPWSKTEKPKEKALTFKLRYSKRQLKVGETVNVRATLDYHRPNPTYMVVLNVGIPAGFEVVKKDLEKLVGHTIERYEIGANNLVIYLGQIQKGKPLGLNWGLKARYSLKVTTPPSVAYEYYSPSHRDRVDPIELVVGG